MAQETINHKQRFIDVSNLEFYARMFKEYGWETNVMHWNVFEATLKEIASRIRAGYVACPQCGRVATWQDISGTYWDDSAHYWRVDGV